MLNLDLIATRFKTLRMRSNRGESSLIGLYIGLSYSRLIDSDEAARIVVDLAGAPSSYWRDVRRGANLAHFLERMDRELDDGPPEVPDNLDPVYRPIFDTFKR